MTTETTVAAVGTGISATATRCPWCGGILEKHVGLVEEPTYRSMTEPTRTKTLRAWVGCTGCEFCEVVV